MGASTEAEPRYVMPPNMTLIMGGSSEEGERRGEGREEEGERKRVCLSEPDSSSPDADNNKW